MRCRLITAFATGVLVVFTVAPVAFADEGIGNYIDEIASFVIPK